MSAENTEIEMARLAERVIGFEVELAAAAADAGRGFGQIGRGRRAIGLLNAMLHGRLGQRLREDLAIADLVRTGGFDAGGYLRRYPDVMAAGLDPLVHYVRYGVAEGRVASAPRSESDHGRG